MQDRASSPRGGLAAPVSCKDQELKLIEDEFCWGQKASAIQENNIVYYESFSFGGTEYSCYDSIYLYKEGDPEPYIGKILEVWEDRVENRNKMKVLWFFRPIEIPKWLEDESKPTYKEIFLASGKGKCVTNVINTLKLYYLWRLFSCHGIADLGQCDSLLLLGALLFLPTLFLHLVDSALPCNIHGCGDINMDYLTDAFFLVTDDGCDGDSVAFVSFGILSGMLQNCHSVFGVPRAMISCLLMVSSSDGADYVSIFI